MKNWRDNAAMYRWFWDSGADEVCCLYWGQRIRLATWLSDGFTYQL